MADDRAFETGGIAACFGGLVLGEVVECGVGHWVEREHEFDRSVGQGVGFWVWCASVLLARGDQFGNPGNSLIDFLGVLSEFHDRCFELLGGHFELLCRCFELLGG